MSQLYQELEEHRWISTALWYAYKIDMNLSAEENETVRMTVKASEQFQAVTLEFSGEKFTTISKICSNIADEPNGAPLSVY